MLPEWIEFFSLAVVFTAHIRGIVPGAFSLIEANKNRVLIHEKSN